MDPIYKSDQRFNPPYATPVVKGPQPQINPSPIVSNQPVPVVATVVPIMMNPEIFRTTPIFIQCPFCLNMVSTVVKKCWNWGACCLCFCTGYLFYMCIQFCRNKDFLCFDAEHSCSVCGAKLANYSAC